MICEPFITLLNPSEVAKILRIQVKTLAQWRSYGVSTLPYCKIGSRVLYKKSDVDKFIRENTRLSSGKPDCSSKEVS